MKVFVVFLPRFLFLVLLVAFLVSFPNCSTKTSQVVKSTEQPKISLIPTGIIKEGWIDNDTFQAYIKEPFSQDMERHIDKAKVRLAWLLLLDSYRLRKEDYSIAKRLVNSSLYKRAGEQQVFHKIENEKAYVLVTLKADNLKEAWEYARLKIEDKLPKLQSVRKD